MGEFDRGSPHRSNTETIAAMVGRGAGDRRRRSVMRAPVAVNRCGRPAFLGLPRHFGFLLTADEMKRPFSSRRREPSPVVVVASEARVGFWQTFCANRFPHSSYSGMKDREWTSFDLHKLCDERITTLIGGRCKMYSINGLSCDCSTTCRRYLQCSHGCCPSERVSNVKMIDIVVRTEVR